MNKSWGRGGEEDGSEKNIERRENDTSCVGEQWCWSFISLFVYRHWNTYEYILILALGKHPFCVVLISWVTDGGITVESIRHRRSFRLRTWKLTQKASLHRLPASRIHPLHISAGIPFGFSGQTPSRSCLWTNKAALTASWVAVGALWLQTRPSFFFFFFAGF